MKISTTNSISGFNIIKHIDIVSSRMVAGTNIFTEAFASFADVFGGRSESFENNLDNLYKKLLIDLQKKAKRLGANAVIGISFDIDEISGKNFQMFMISGIGTAVIIEKDNKNNKLEKGFISGNVLKDKLLLLEIEKEIDSIISTEPSQMETKVFDSIDILKNCLKNNYIINLEKFFKLYFITHISFSHANDSKLIDDIKFYLTNFLDEDTIKAYYLAFLHEYKNNFYNYTGKKTRLLEFVSLNKLNIPTKYSEIYKTMNKIPAGYWQELVFPQLLNYQNSYNSDTIIEINKIIDLLKNPSESIYPEIENQKGKIEWECSCGKVNSKDQKICKNCKKNNDITSYSKDEKVSNVMGVSQ